MAASGKKPSGRARATQPTVSRRKTPKIVDPRFKGSTSRSASVQRKSPGPTSNSVKRKPKPQPDPGSVWKESDPFSNLPPLGTSYNKSDKMPRVRPSYPSKIGDARKKTFFWDGRA